METVNALLLLYSQADEFYNGMNDSKFSVYQDRIQNMLVRPEVLLQMQTASKDPEAYAREEALKK